MKSLKAKTTLKSIFCRTVIKSLHAQARFLRKNPVITLIQGPNSVSFIVNQPDSTCLPRGGNMTYRMSL